MKDFPSRDRLKRVVSDNKCSRTRICFSDRSFVTWPSFWN